MYSPSDERRGRVRLHIQFPVVIAATDRAPESHGLTRDVSQSGVFFYTESPLTVGDVLAFKMLMPMPGNAQTPVFCRGKVVRVETMTAVGPSGAAVAITELAHA